MKQAMSANQYAAHRGCAYNTVKKAINNGRLDGALTRDPKTGRWIIDVELADQLWEANKRVDRIDPEKVEAVAEDEIKEGVSELSESVQSTASSYNKARTVQKTFQAKIAQLDYNSRIGELVSRTEVHKRYFEISRKVRNTILSIPQRIMDRLAAETDPFEVQKILNEELNQALEELSNDIGSEEPQDGQ